MKDNYLAAQRIYNQHIYNPKFSKPEDVVKHMIAMQAQDYAGAKWAIGLRMPNTSEEVIEQAITEGKILRTHLLRPTWHFVLPQDIRWLLTLTAPRINAINAAMSKKFELTDHIFAKSNAALEKALAGNRQLTRPELVNVFEQAGIATDELRFTILLMRAELDQVICSGARIGKQFTYALLDDRAPLTPVLTHEEALTKLARGYFNSRGPATLYDFANWSGLTLTDAGIGLEHIKSQLISDVIDGRTYWMPDSITDLPSPKTKAYLLPAFDEFAIAYKDRDALVNPKYLKQARHVIFDPAIVVDNQVVGTWKRTLKAKSVDINLNLFGSLNKTQEKAVEVATSKYRKFLFP
ncbi:Winged helix DNA-binding domain-containing protein [Mucilaginibacter sp. OK268]|uniref:winged helix DNA-binding domain-containing protein n=1 Tax=Mucilaginibacter sp. OK268 TaxID=1881048 RepID=UPI00088F6D74|nr:winged helix DNA-binding domain-containing protein [Mucilaginibacter sp. OK268]SDP92646.1 Winged helix DNA-binding domain-containing protein [Mucilaginibacter sp. OK268]